MGVEVLDFIRFGVHRWDDGEGEHEYHEYHK